MIDHKANVVKTITVNQSEVSYVIDIFISVGGGDFADGDFKEFDIYTN